MDFAAAVGLRVLCCGRLSLCLLSKFVVFVFVADRVPVLRIKKPVAQQVLQPSPRTPNFNVEVVGPREYTGHGEYKPVSAMAHVEALSTLKLGGAGGLARTQTLFMNRLLYSQHRNPFNINKSRFLIEITKRFVYFPDYLSRPRTQIYQKSG
jgi:hypothetical protein